MKRTLLLIALFCPTLMVGCGEGGNQSVTDGVEMSDIEKYNAMRAEAEAEMQKSADAEAEMASGKKKK